MPFYKFDKFDKIVNTIKAYPKVEFTIWSGSVFYNNHAQTASNSNVPNGFISLYNMNVGRVGSGSLTVAGTPPISDLVYPFVIKGENNYESMKEVGSSNYLNNYEVGDQVNGKYPLTASITRNLYYYDGKKDFVIENADGTIDQEELNKIDSQTRSDWAPFDPLTVKSGDNSDHPKAKAFKFILQQGVKDSHHGLIDDNLFNPDISIIKEFFTGDAGQRGRRRRYLESLKNTLNHYTYMSKHYQYKNPGDWNKQTQPLNLINIPSIFYGNSIKKGSVNLKFYVTGTLIGELLDEKQNGELIQIGPEGSTGSGSVAGVALYNEGFVLLTGSWDLSGLSAGQQIDDYVGLGIATDKIAKWIHFGASLPSWRRQRINSIVNADLTVKDWADQPVYAVSSSFKLDFKGVNVVPTMTMFAHAKKGELNHSNNFSYIDLISLTASSEASMVNKYEYVESDKTKIKNIVKSEHDNYKEPFQKHTYISKIGIYDENQNLIAVAKLSNPIKKKEDRELTFKMKLDI